MTIAEKAISDSFGPEALARLGEYQTGLMHQSIKDAENGITQWIWDFMISTDPEFLSDGYRVQFYQTVNDHTGEIFTMDLWVETANIGNG